ncbi:hypothetical protein BKA24_001317 [Microbacterium marinum]|uniref:Antitoxin VbhA domain-containing protein n=1 Tax=Microbacterium marinum TaxID=421115 RepID=A0A7W7FIY9_9MICO|nr:hypothetical protein [Microbacterium marinum]MBB4666608.1 hypothetical protein [Microbacterium marinum]
MATITKARTTHTAATPRPATSTAAGADERMAFADAALALAGHEVTDSTLRTILERAARHELSGDEARAAIRRHVQG